MLLDRLRGNPIDTPQAPRSILPDNIPLEFQVLLSACRVFLGTEEHSSLKARLAQGPDWDKLLRLANRHGVMPLLYRSISKNCPRAVPQEWLRRLMLQYMQNAARNMKMTKELLRLLDIFEANGIQAIPFKGPALAQQIFGDIALRMFSDLDIIAPKQQVLIIKEILSREGYTQKVQLDPAQEGKFLKSDCEYKFFHEVKDIMVEVHWQLSPSCYSIRFDDKGVLSRLRTTILEDRTIATLSLEDLLIALCIHNAKHCWEQLRLSCDVAGLIYLQGDINWKQVESYAREIRTERIFLLGLFLAKFLLKIELQEELLGKIERDMNIKLMAISIWRNILANFKVSSSLSGELSFWMLAREHRLDSLSCILRLALEPNDRDLSLIPLPIWLYSLYYLIHPLRLVLQYGIK